MGGTEKLLYQSVPTWTTNFGGANKWLKRLWALLSSKSQLVKQHQRRRLVALGQHGVNIMSFTKEFNERTKNDVGLVIPVIITVYADRSFTFVTKTPPAAVLLKKAAGIDKASGEPNKTKVATVTKEQVQKIAETKMKDLNAASLEAAMSMVAGTARSMGITVAD